MTAIMRYAIRATIELLPPKPYELPPETGYVQAARIACDTYPRATQYVVPVYAETPGNSIAFADHVQRVSGKSCALNIKPDQFDIQTLTRIQRICRLVGITTFVLTPDGAGDTKLIRSLEFFRTQMPNSRLIAPLPLPGPNFSEDQAIGVYTRLVRAGCSAAIVPPECSPKYWGAFMQLASYHVRVTLPLFQAVKPLPREHLPSVLESDSCISPSIRRGLEMVWQTGQSSTESVARDTLIAAQAEASKRSIRLVGAYLDLSEIDPLKRDEMASHVTGRHQ